MHSFPDGPAPDDKRPLLARGRAEVGKAENVDLHRKLTQKGPFIASKFTRLRLPKSLKIQLFALLGVGHFQVANGGSIQRANQQAWEFPIQAPCRTLTVTSTTLH